MKINNYSRTPNIKNETLEEFWTDFFNAETHTVSRNDMREDATVMACVSIISSYIASMSLQLFKYDTRDTIQVTNALTDRLERPNKIQSQFEFIKFMVQEMLINGNSFARIVFKGGEIISIDPIENGVLSEALVGSNVWTVQGSIRGQHIVVPYENCLHFRDLFDRYKTLEPVLETKLIANDLIKKAFSSGLQNNIKAILKLEGKASADTKIKIKESFNKALKSSNDNVAVLDKGLDLETVNGGSHSFTESQVSEIIDMLDNKIHQILNVPLVMTGIAEGSYNISENLKISFIESLLPYIKMIEKELDYKLLTKKEKKKYYFKINYKSLMRTNDKDRMEFYQKAINNGIYTRQEIRKLEDLPYIDGTDSLDMSLNYVPIQKYDEYLEKRYNTSNVVKSEENNQND